MGKDTLLTLTRRKQLELLYWLGQSGFKNNDNYKFKEDHFISNKDLLYSTGNSAQSYGQPGWEGRLGGEIGRRMDTCICMAEALCYPPKTITKLLIGYVYVWSLLIGYTPWTLLVAQMVKNLPAMQETWVQFLGWKDPLEEGMATHSSMLAWRIPWTEESMGLQSVGHDWATNTFTFLTIQNWKLCLKNKENHFITVKGTVHQNDLIVLSIYSTSNRTSKYMKQKQTDFKGETDKSRVNYSF